ncbi:MAG: S41 family peptidase [Chthoniobacterales bacterium]|jgi:hypothetical protein
MNKLAWLLFFAPVFAHAQEPASSPAAAPTPVPAPVTWDARERLEALDAAQIKLATETILANHAGAPALDETGMARATLRGLLDGLYPGAELTGGETTKPDPAPFRAEILDGQVGYIRLGSIGTESIAQLDAALQEFAEKKVVGLVIDLRATPESSDFPLAAQVCERFVANGTALFSLVRPAAKQEKIFTSSRATVFPGVIVVLADGDTAGAAEVIAAVLRRHARATVIGTNTGGRAAEFALLPLGGGHHLRYAAAEVRVAGLPPLCPRGLSPDLEVVQTPGDKKIIFDGALENGVAGYVFETERARINEAALVAGTNPEIDAEDTPTGLLDRPLQRAVDLVVAIKLFRKDS